VKDPAPREELALFAERFMHFMNVWTVYSDMLTGHYVPTIASPGEGWAPFPNTGATMMFLLYATFYSLIDGDPKSVNAFRVWRRNFPEEETGIAAVEAQVKPFEVKLKRFRNRLGFHGSRSRAHEASGFDLFADKYSGTAIWNAMSNFKHFGAVLFAKDMERHKAPHGKDEPAPDPLL
jgi:hypothetical protein